MVHVKIRYGKKTRYTTRPSFIKKVDMAYSRALDEGYLCLRYTDGIYDELRVPRDENQRITFYSSGRRIKEFVLPAGSGVDTLMNVTDQVKDFVEYAKSIESIDGLK